MFLNIYYHYYTNVLKSLAKKAQGCYYYSNRSVNDFIERLY